MKEIWCKIIDFVSSLKLTIACLSAALVLVFAGTIAQVHMGTHEAQVRYFQSMFIWWPPNATGFKMPVFPGGHLLGAVLLLNLIAGHIRRFRWTMRKAGIQLTHLGLIVMLGGGLFTDMFAVDSTMRLGAGETKNYLEDSMSMELAVIDETDKELDQVTAIPDARLRRGGVIEHDSLPFRIIVRHFYQNSQIQMLDKVTNGPAAATQGIGAQVAVTELPRATAPNTSDSESAVIEVQPEPKGDAVTMDPLGTWLVSDQLGAPQRFSYAGKTWRLVMRPTRYYRNYSIALKKFTHEVYAGTDVPRNFASHVKLIDPEHSENRDVLIYMNHPLRYHGDTFYQAGFENGDTATILEVVHNPAFVAPYLACLVVATGLLIQFSYHLAGFSRRQRAALAT